MKILRFFLRRDSGELAKKINLLYCDSELRTKIGVSFKKHITSHFSWKGNGEKIIDVYNTLIGNRCISVFSK